MDKLSAEHAKGCASFYVENCHGGTDYSRCNCHVAEIERLERTCVEYSDERKRLEGELRAVQQRLILSPGTSGYNRKITELEVQLQASTAQVEAAQKEAAFQKKNRNFFETRAYYVEELNTQLTARVERLREALQRISEWPLPSYDRNSVRAFIGEVLSETSPKESE